MWKLLIVLCIATLAAPGVFAQSEEQDAQYLPKANGVLNIGVVWGINKGTVTKSDGAYGLMSSWVNVPVIKLGYEYMMSNNWGINSSFGVGFQPFKYVPDFEDSKISASKVAFSMPYGILSIGIKKQNDAGTYMGFGGGVHINSQKTFESTILVSRNEAGVTDTISNERNLSEYAGVQHELFFMLGKRVNKGALRGLDIYLTSSFVTREKLIVEYGVSKGDNYSSGKIRYTGGYVGVGLRFFFFPSSDTDLAE